jgi:hypothetical protein
MELTPNTPITRRDLVCPDEKLEEILKNVVCCTDCDFVFKLDGNRLVINNKSKEHVVDLTKYLGDTTVTDFRLENNGILLKQNNGTSFNIPFDYIINRAIYAGVSIQSSNGRKVQVKIEHGLTHTPNIFTLQATAKDSRDISYVTADEKEFTIWYDVAPKVGVNNLTYSWIIRL